MCGIWAFLGLNAGSWAHLASPWLIHRGQEGVSYACATNDSIIKINNPSSVPSKLCLGHARYSTSGPYGISTQPIVLGNDFAMVFNGTITNYTSLRSKLRSLGVDMDSNYDALILAHYIRYLLTRYGIEHAAESILSDVIGGYAVIVIWRNKLIMIRDPWGLRPLFMGINDSVIGVASESIALESLGFKWREIEPGRVLVLGGDGEQWIKGPRVKHAYCALEYIYFMHPESYFNGVSVYEARRRLGITLAKREDVSVDVVSPIPETARVAAQAYANHISKPYEELIIKNRFLGRGFIKPPNERKLNMYSIVKNRVFGQSLSLIDDSIIRGDTLKKIAPILRKSGAKSIHVRVTSPPIRYPCFMGMDFPTRSELIAHGKSVDEVRKLLDLDSLRYITVSELKEAVGIEELCTACFLGNYPFPVNLDEVERAFTGDRTWA